jgi:phage tail-like protein
MNLQGTVVKRYRVFRCWVSEFTALPELDANANAVAFEHIVLQNEGYERDDSVVEVAET